MLILLQDIYTYCIIVISIVVHKAQECSRTCTKTSSSSSTRLVVSRLSSNIGWGTLLVLLLLVLLIVLG